MEFITVRELRLKPAQVWKRLRTSVELVITTRGRPVALMTSVRAGQLEETLLAAKQARAIQAVAAMQRRSVERGLHRLSDQDIQASIRAVHRSRKR